MKNGAANSSTPTDDALKDSAPKGSASIEKIVGSAIPVRGDDIDTDRIIPARFLRCVTFEGLGEHAFEDDRLQAAGEHPFDQKRFGAAQILVVNRNFGCGSSREHAPQSLMRWGIQAVIGESFAEIFFGNCVALGIPCARLDPQDVAALQNEVEKDANLVVELNLRDASVRAAEKTFAATLPEGVRDSFLRGTWDATRLLLADPGDIAAVAERLPYVTGFR